MIIGNGLIANVFQGHDQEEVVFFASGVSNSLETDKSAFLREENLLRKTIEDNKDKILLYFSTCSIYDSSKTDSPYVHHKLRMEQLVEECCARFLILRISNAVGRGGNPNLLVNYLFNSIQEEKTVVLHTLATRNLIDADDVKNIALQLLADQVLNKTINVAYLENFSPLEMVAILEKHLRKKIKTETVRSGQSYLISIPEVESYFTKNNLKDKEAYLCRILERYYS